MSFCQLYFLLLFGILKCSCWWPAPVYVPVIGLDCDNEHRLNPEKRDKYLGSAIEFVDVHHIEVIVFMTIFADQGTKNEKIAL